jgi:hypothetical protein
LPDKFVAGDISPSYHLLGRTLPPPSSMRQDFNVEELIGTLDVEERARAKENRKGVETSIANVVQKKFRKFNKKKNKNKQENTPRLVQTA